MNIGATFNAAASRLSLASLDQCWAEQVRSSKIWKLATLFKWPLTNQRLGEALQQASFGIVMLLFLILGLPQFASDKEGLALISSGGLVLFVLGRALGGGQSRRSNMVDALVLLYFGANIVATFASHYMIESIKGLSKTAVYILNYFLLTAVLNKSPGRINKVMAAALVAGLAVSLYGLYQYKIGVAPLATWEDPTVESKGTRIYSTLGNPNLLAGYLIPLFPMAAALGLNALAALKGWQRWLGSLTCFGTAAVIGLAAILTGSRGGYLAVGAMGGAMVLSVVIYVLSEPKNRKFIAPTILAVIVSLGLTALAVHFLVPSFEQRLTSIFAGSEHSSNAYRLYVWRASLKMFEDNWWFGVGPGNTTFRLAYGLYMRSGFDALGTYCVPLEVGVECGFLGLAAFILIIISLLCRGHLLFWQSHSPIYRWNGLGLSVALLGLSVQGLVDTVFYRPQVHFIFWLTVAGLVTLFNLSREKIVEGVELSPKD